MISTLSSPGAFSLACPDSFAHVDSEYPYSSRVRLCSRLHSLRRPPSRVVRDLCPATARPASACFCLSFSPRRFLRARACLRMVRHAGTSAVDTPCACATPRAMTWDDMDVASAGCVILSITRYHLLTLRADHRPRSLRAAPAPCSPPSRGASRSRHHRRDHQHARLSSPVAQHCRCRASAYICAPRAVSCAPAMRQRSSL
jgi:hypothetical protein